MRIVVVGPTHPYKGGIAQHTTRLAHELRRAGHDVVIESWSRQYPKALYPGAMTVPGEKPEMEPFGNVRRRLAWNRPDSWVAAGRRARDADLVVLAVASTVQIAPYRVLRAAIGKGPRVVAIMHNVLPHEHKPWDRGLVTGFLRSVDHVVVHSAEQQQLASSLAATPVTTTPLPALLEVVAEPAPRRRDADAPLRVLSFGLVRPYKGVDLLVRATAEVPNVRLTVAGEFWTPVEEFRALVAELGIGDRVDLRAGYVAAEDMDELFAAADVVAMPYRHVTGSGNLRLAFQYRRPVVVSRVGMLADEVGDDNLGFVCEPDDVPSLAEALRKISQPEVYNAIVDRLEDHAAAERGKDWQDYVTVMAGLGVPRGGDA